MNIKYFLIPVVFIINSQIFGQGIFKSTNNTILQVQSDSIASNDDKSYQVLNAFNFDSNAKAIDFSFLQPINEKRKNIWLGFSIEGKSNNSIAKIFENGSFTPSYKISGNLIYNIPLRGKPTKSMVNTRNNYIKAGKSIQKIYNGLQDSLKMPKNIPLSLVAKIDTLKKYDYKNEELMKLIALRDTIKVKNSKMTYVYDGIRIGINSSFEGRGFYNYIRNSIFQDELVEKRKNIKNYSAFINYFTYDLKKFGPYIGGFSFGNSDTDNFSRMTEVSVINTWKSEDKNGTSRSTSQKLTAYEGNYDNSVKQFKFGVDQYFVPDFLDRKIGLSFNYTYYHYPNKDNKDHQDFTLGLYFIKDSPFAPLQGFIFSFKDFRKKLEIPETQTRFSIGYTRQLNMYRVLKATTSDDK
ncbi:MAG TPA: hypothetical protein PKD85_16870 [Saprospiraceae bacterium]|nr:hypothetical protein [Saprospiraceae bacterium]